MKKIFYSSAAKLIAFIICIASFTGCAYITVSSFIGNDMIYMFEDSYLSSHALARPLENTFMELRGILYTGLTPEQMNIDSGEWDYYVNKNGTVYTNVENASYDLFSQSDAAMGLRSDGKNSDGFSNSAAHLANYLYSPYINSYDSDDISENGQNAQPFEICVRMNSGALEKHTYEWNALRDNAVNKFGGICALIILSAAAFVFLLFVTGRKYDEDNIQTVTIDRMFVEINLAVIACAGIGGILMAAWIISLIFNNHMTLLDTSIIPLAAVWSSVILALVLSLVRNVKNKTFLERSAAVRIVKFLWKIALKIIRFLFGILRKIISRIRTGWHNILHCLEKDFSQRKAAAAFLAYSVILMILSLSMLTVIMIPVALIFIGAAVIYVFRRLEGFDKIIDGVEKMRGGDINHKIDGCPDGIMSDLADNLNSIGDGLKQSLDREIKAERMKSELITNVSHDLKTPLTSIISYADLLCAETLSPPEANDYVKIIKQKSERLRTLTEDLFEVSKAQSGNSEFNIEEIDICLLINQTLAELNESITKSGLEFVSDLKENEMFVLGDGKKLSRVFENLIGNCLKYSMKGTRVYINVRRDGDMIRAEIKNIAGYRMEFDSEEITERFVRGDKSRSSEGSGLGLAIVKSYVEGCSGQFKAIADGDLFKAVVLLRPVSENMNPS